MYSVFSSSFVMSQDLSLNYRMHKESKFGDGEYLGSNVCPSSIEMHSMLTLSSYGKGQVENSFSSVLSMTPKSTISPNLLRISCNNVGEVGKVDKCCSATL